MENNQAQSKQVSEQSKVQLRRLMYERIAQGNALSETDYTAHNALKAHPQKH